MADWIQVLTALSFWLVPLYFQGACPCCGLTCANCDPVNTAHQQIQIVVAGITNGSCVDCAGLNATYLCDYQVGFTCRWFMDFTLTCTLTTIVAELKAVPAALDVNIVTAGGTSRVTYRSGAAGYNKCEEWASFSVTYLTDAGICNASASTCLVTVL